MSLWYGRLRRAEHDEGVVSGDAGCGSTETLPPASARAAAGSRVRNGKRGAASESALRVSSRTIRRWRARWRTDGVRGLIPRYPLRRRRRIAESLIDLIRRARVDHSYGSTRTQIWLWRVYRLRVSQTTIQRVVRELGLPRVKPARKRRPRQLKL